MTLFERKRILEYLNWHISRPHRKGHGIHSPFLYAFIWNTFPSYRRYKNKRIEKLRKELLRNTETIIVEDFGAGSRKNSLPERRICDIAKHAPTKAKRGVLLYRMVQYLKPDVIIELGTSLGIGTLYLSAGRNESTVYTIEGSKNIAQLASNHFKQLNAENIKLIEGNFDTEFPKLLDGLLRFDLLYIDGNHSHEATIRYFNLASKYAGDNSVIVIDDIRWSEGMYYAWLEICGNQHAKLTLDLFDFGIVFYNNKIIKQHFRLYY